jgi:hypothetical protein
MPSLLSACFSSPVNGCLKYVSGQPCSKKKKKKHEQQDHGWSGVMHSSACTQGQCTGASKAALCAMPDLLRLTPMPGKVSSVLQLSYAKDRKQHCARVATCTHPCEVVRRTSTSVCCVQACIAG